MEPEAEPDRSPEIQFCPECGAVESGYFCRNCGALVRGEEMVLCPRCHHVVPNGEFCNQCGQGLEGIALNLRQLAFAGGDFWVTASAVATPATALEDMEPSLMEPDESVVLAEGDLPDWLQDLPVDSAPADVKAHIYPSLRPIEVETASPGQRRFLPAVIFLLALLLLSLIVLVLVLLSQSVG